MKNQNIPKKILHWYDNNKRVLPWRNRTSKKQMHYFTLVSEFMLQQTQVKTVIPYFNNFVNKNKKKINVKMFFFISFYIVCLIQLMNS